MNRVLLMVCSLCCSTAFAQQTQYDSASRNIFQLGEVVITGEKTKPVYHAINARKLQEFGKNDVARALNIRKY